ncbi:hypothetical protein GGR50DRAFT_620263 [Xylaria sp. CBS 124048]|nr:hypothetical protein GGR50DRAFT_620263 [Xylaria sp. CBS 124048]
MASTNTPCACRQPITRSKVKALVQGILSGKLSVPKLAESAADCPVCSKTSKPRQGPKPNCRSPRGEHPPASYTEKKAQTHIRTAADNLQRTAPTSTTKTKTENQVENQTHSQKEAEADEAEVEKRQVYAYDPDDFTPEELRVHAEISRYIWGEEHNGARTEAEEVLIHRVCSMLSLEGSPALLFLRYGGVDRVPDFVRGGIDQIISTQIRESRESGFKGGE